MTSFTVTRVNPTDQNWEIDAPTYRVYFADSAAPRAATDEKRITGATCVTDVLAWADADGRDYTLWVEYTSQNGLGLILLAGWDPNRVD